jgi:hypothetical protein
MVSASRPSSYQVSNKLDAENREATKTIKTDYKKDEAPKTFEFDGLSPEVEYSIACTGWNTYPRYPQLMDDDKLFHEMLVTSPKPEEVVDEFSQELALGLVLLFAVLG